MSKKRPIASTVDYKFEHNPHDGDDIMAFHHPYRNHIDIYLELIDTPAQLFDTFEHEALHECFLSEDLDVDVEHRMITAIQFAHHDMYTPGETWF